MLYRVRGYIYRVCQNDWILVNIINFQTAPIVLIHAVLSYGLLNTMGMSHLKIILHLDENKAIKNLILIFLLHFLMRFIPYTSLYNGNPLYQTELHIHEETKICALHWDCKLAV